MLLAVGLGIACGVAVFGGGFEDGERLAFVICAGVLAGVATAFGRGGAAVRSGGTSGWERAARVAGSPALLGLMALAAISAISAAWTIAPPDEALLWGLVLSGYAATAVASGVVTLRSGPAPVAAILAALAGAAALAGLIAACLGEVPYAERLGGSWRPGGPFEYPPALAFSQVMALPPLLAAMCAQRRRSSAGPGTGRRRQCLAAAGVCGWVLAAAVLGLADSRTALALAAAAAALMLVAPPPGVGRRDAVAASALLAVCGAAAHLAVGGTVDGPDRGIGELAVLALVLAGSALAWVLWLGVRSHIERYGPRPALGSAALSGRRRAALVGGMALMGVLVLAAGADTPEGPGIEKASGFAHGREVQWEAALTVFAREPLVGSGAESYLEASRDDQGNRPIRYAHNLPLEVAAELGLLGLAALALALGGAATAWWGSRGSEGWRLLAIAAAVVPVANLVDWSWHLAGLGALWALALGALVGSGPQPERGAGSGTRKAGGVVPAG